MGVLVFVCMCVLCYILGDIFEDHGVCVCRVFVYVCVMLYFRGYFEDHGVWVCA